MRTILISCCCIFLFACNNSSTKKVENKESKDSTVVSQPVPVAIKPVQLTAAQIPASVTYKGKLEEAWQWNDKLGDNIFITSLVGTYDEKIKNENDEIPRTAELYALHYVKKDGGYTLLWTTSDSIKTCEFDVTCKFLKGGTTVTDLDKNGIAETKFLYATACRSDVSPSYMKLIMYENKVQYTLGGSMWLPYSSDLKYEVTEENVDLEKSPKKSDEMEELVRTMGRYETEKDFAAAPPSFLPYARSEWLKYSKEKLEE